MIDVEKHEAAEAARRAAGMVDNAHHTAQVPTIKAMRKAGNHDEAAALLLRCIEAIEREAAIPLPGHGVPPWCFEQLATIYRKAGRPDDAGQVLQRLAALEAATPQHRAQTAPGPGQGAPRAAEPAPGQPAATAPATGGWLSRLFGK